MFVGCECSVLSGRGTCDELITCPEESYRLCRVVCVETSWQRRPWPTGGLSRQIKTKAKRQKRVPRLITRNICWERASVWQQPTPFACFPIQTNLGTFYVFYNSIPLSLSKPPREKKTCYVTLGSDVLHLSETKKNCGVPRWGENMCPAVRRYKVFLLADTLIRGLEL